MKQLIVLYSMQLITALGSSGRKDDHRPHAGFGLGFERTVSYVTGMGNVRDVIPFPRTPGNAEF